MVIALASRSQQKWANPKNGKIASGLRARRGSNPFPGAINILLDKHPASRLLGLSKDFALLVIANVLETCF